MWGFLGKNLKEKLLWYLDHLPLELVGRVCRLMDGEMSFWKTKYLSMEDEQDVVVFFLCGDCAVVFKGSVERVSVVDLNCEFRLSISVQNLWVESRLSEDFSNLGLLIDEMANNEFALAQRACYRWMPLHLVWELVR